MTSTADRLAELATRTHAATHSASERAVEKQHSKGKLTARERIDLLLDVGSFVELDAFARNTGGGGDPGPVGDGVVTGHGLVDGRPVCVFAHDFTVLGGSLGEVFGRKVVKVMDLAVKIGCPIVGINDSGGARIHEGVVALAYYAEIGRRTARASGVVPQISLIMGPCAGGAVYAPAMTDFVVMVAETSHMFVTGPDVVRAVTGERTSFDELGGTGLNAEIAGNAHYVAHDEKDAFEWTRELLGLLPSNNLEFPVVQESSASADVTDLDRTLDRLIPDAPNAGYDMGEAIRAVLDDGELLEIAGDFAHNMICGLGRVEGAPVGVVANQPRSHAGIIDIDASEKAARFVRFCDAFNIPLVTFVDVPGYLPGLEQERRGIIRRGAKLLYAYSEATVPMVTVVLRKAYGGGYATMGSKHLGADVNFAWPTAEIAVMGGAGAVSVLYRSEIDEAQRRGDAETVRAELIERYRSDFANPYAAAEHGYIDAVIMPSQTRLLISRALRGLRTKSVPGPARKHGNLPL